MRSAADLTGGGKGTGASPSLGRGGGEGREAGAVHFAVWGHREGAEEGQSGGEDGGGEVQRGGEEDGEGRVLVFRHFPVPVPPRRSIEEEPELRLNLPLGPREGSCLSQWGDAGGMEVYKGRKGSGGLEQPCGRQVRGEGEGREERGGPAREGGGE